MTGDRQRLPVTAAVLAGGRSLRMGIDKTLLPLDGEPLVSRVAETVFSVCEHTVVVTNRPEALEDIQFPDGVCVLTDDIAYQGPLGGLATALAHAEDEWVLAVAADMPWLRPEVVRALWDARDGAQVVVPITDKGPEPLLALYHTDCLPAARRVLDSGRRRLVAIFKDVKVVAVPVDDLRTADPDLKSLMNVNTPEDLADARESDTSESGSVESEVRLSVIEVDTRRPRGMPVERPITVYMNDIEIATMQATPNHLEELGVGFLLAEGLLLDRDALTAVDVDHKRGMVYVTSEEAVPDDMVFRTRYVTSGCGKGMTFSSVGHARNLEHITSDLKVDSQTVYDMMGQLARIAECYRDTGGVHSCGLGHDGQVVLACEDVGRHNALDKLLGRAWLDRVPTVDGILLSTGRISYEMAVKAAKARVPVVASRTAVTDLAAEISAELGITIAGYARGGKLVVYTHPERIHTPDREA